MSKSEVWDEWVKYHDFDAQIPLFDTDKTLTVQTEQFGHGPHERSVLKRSSAMAQMVQQEANKVETDLQQKAGEFEGVIYVMYWTDADDNVIPLYIGKSGKFDTNGYNLNPNLKRVENRAARFARWGYGTAFHLGKLSEVFFDSSWESSGEITGASKGRWIQTLFEPRTRKLKQETYLWMKAWNVDDIGPYTPFCGASPYLRELENQLIAIAYELYPELLLNSEGLPGNPDAYAEMRGWTDQLMITDFEG